MVVREVVVGEVAAFAKMWSKNGARVRFWVNIRSLRRKKQALKPLLGIKTSLTAPKIVHERHFWTTFWKFLPNTVPCSSENRTREPFFGHHLRFFAKSKLHTQHNRENHRAYPVAHKHFTLCKQELNNQLSYREQLFFAGFTKQLGPVCESDDLVPCKTTEVQEVIIVDKNVLLVTVSSSEMQKIRGTRYINFQQCTMPYLAAFFSPDWNITHVDEVCETINYDLPYDLVGLTFHTPSAPHAYEIADRFRARGITVIMGGPHVTLVPEEAQEHADAIFVGEAELTLPRFLAEWTEGRAQRRYDVDEIPDLCKVPFSIKEHFHRKDHSDGILFASRGCPNGCEFCTLAVMYKRQYRHRPISDVAAEFASFRGKVIIFWDDNLSADMNYAKELCRAIAPYNKWWSSQVSAQAGTDDEFLTLAAKSGCKQLFIGFESVSQKSLEGVQKGFNRTDQYAEIIRRIHDHGIAVQAGFVFGFDEDTPEVFEETIAFLEDTAIQNATFHILTPYPGTSLYKRLMSEGRILTHDWARYNARTDVVFEPKNMSSEELLNGFNEVNRRFYSLGSIYRRLTKSPVGLYWTLPLNLIYHNLWHRRQG